MPPVDPSAATPAPEQAPAPGQTPAPVPEQPKKPGFFARLFGGGKKAAAPAVPPNFESQTPAPQLDDADRTMTPPVTPEVSSPVDPGATLNGPSEQFPPTTDSPAEPQLGGAPTLPPAEPPVAGVPSTDEPEDPNTPPRPL